VVDHSARALGFDPTPFNQARDQSGANPPRSPPCSSPRTSRLAQLRLGPSYPVPFPGLQFRRGDGAVHDAARAERGDLARGDRRQHRERARRAVDRIGAAAVIVHSQSGVYGLDLVRQRPKLVRALSPWRRLRRLHRQGRAAYFTKVPVLSLWGDNSVGAKQTVNGDAGATAAAIGQRDQGGGGGRARRPSDIGIKGNSHMMMMDRTTFRSPTYPEVAGGKRGEVK